MKRPSLCLLARSAMPVGMAGLVSCGGATNREDASPRALDVMEARVELVDGDVGATWRELAVPAANMSPKLVRTPSGWLALSQRTLGYGKAPSAYSSYLYRSEDGISWQSVPVSSNNETLWLRGVAYGAGHYVLAGARFGLGGGNVLFSSKDGQSWVEQAVEVDAPSGLGGVVYSGERFFASSTHRTLLSSADAEHWTSIDLEGTVMPQDVAFGDGRYLLVGSGAPQLSSDGLAWHPAPIGCTVPGACIEDPSGYVGQSIHYRALFADGRYYIDQASSEDAQSWQALPDLYPQASVSGYLLGSRGSEPLVSWKPDLPARPISSVRYADAASEAALGSSAMRWNGAIEFAELDVLSFPQDEPPPETLEFPLSDGANCLVARCLLVGDRLYLLP